LNSNTSRDKKIRERGPIRTVFVAKDGKVVSASSNNYIDTRENFIPSVNIVNIWDCKSSALLYTLRKNDLSVDKITVTCDNKAIFALTDNTIRVWDLNSRKLLHTLKGHTKFITDFAVTDKGKAVSASGDHTLKVWDLNSGKLEHTLEGHSDEVCAVVISNDDQIVSWSKDSTLKVWELNTGRLLRTLEGYSHSYYQKIFLAVSKNGKVVFAQSLHNIPHVWDLATGKFLYELKGYKNKINTINDLVVTADGRAVSVSNMSIIVSDIDSGELLHSINEERKCSAKKFIFSGSGNPEDGNVTEFEVEMNSNEYVHSLVLTEDGNAVSWYWNPTKKELEALKVWDLKSGKFLCSFIGEFCVSACSITDEGTIVAGDSGGYVHFLKLVFPRKYDQT
jgi:WD40 repeat protein